MYSVTEVTFPLVKTISKSRWKKGRINTYVNPELSRLCFVGVHACVYAGSSSVWLDPVKAPNEDVWWPRGGPDSEVDNGLVKISVAQSGCFLWGKTDQIYLPSSNPWPPRHHLKWKKRTCVSCVNIFRRDFICGKMDVPSWVDQNRKKRRRVSVLIAGRCVSGISGEVKSAKI